MKLRYYSIPLAVVALCSVMALFVRFSAAPPIDIQNCNISIQGSFTDGRIEFMDINIPTTMEGATSEAELIVRARFAGDRMVANRGLYSQVTVQEVYKGSEDLVGEQICVVEQLSVFPDYLNTWGVSIPLQEDNDYLLFLRSVSFRPERRLTELQKREYYPVTLTPLSAFRIAKEKQTEVFPEGDLIPLRDLSGYDLATCQEADLHYYYGFRDEQFEKYGIVP